MTGMDDKTRVYASGTKEAEIACTNIIGKSQWVKPELIIVNGDAVLGKSVSTFEFTSTFFAMGAS